MTETYQGWKVDFANPVGATALQSPDSVQWRVFKNPIALGIGGVAAVLMEFADPRIRSGVWDHSTYKADPIGRSMRTGIAAMVGCYGPADAARQVIAGVNRMHVRVKGTTPGGEAYKAMDTELLDWVAATAAYGFVTAYDRFVAPLSDADKARYFSDGATVGRLYGARVIPASAAEFMAMMEKLSPRFEPHPINTEFLDIIQSGKAAPGTPKFLHRALGRAAVSILPPLVRQKLALGPQYDLKLSDRIALQLVGRIAERRPDLSSPACQSSARIGLPADFLYRSPAVQKRLLARLQPVEPVALASAA
ncbi:DUF2236 domain-containing protein [Polymorphobacter arshaanensis]|uniref:DUF2236 domain-containing protein n=1 Tax=Glacieibacterium arshaanense TaxID=2511025 RepID=A0A4Y9EJI9_9SPHN|nr:oxygenase MpaB family protein [Polymorphobacter arshaanensis]TFU00357.1 DUF2236 domain-containing protein [Polymorphobacter arshaanensis]